MVPPDRSTVGPEYRFGGTGHPLKSLLAPSMSEAGPSPGGSSSLSSSPDPSYF